ncbi:MAG: MFS transporter, partial [Bacilli bacterium]
QLGAIVILLLSCLSAAFLDPHSFFNIATSLVLLGIGWNIGLICGTTLIVTHTDITTRATVQGKIDIFVSLAGASGGTLAGLVVGETSFAFLSILCGLLSLLLVPILFQTKRTMAVHTS